MDDASIHLGSTDLTRLFPGDSEMAQRMRAFDWCGSSFGPPAAWPDNLRIALGICLTSHVPMHVMWGASLTFFYNDAYAPFLSRGKHPNALGFSGRDAVSELWGRIGLDVERVLETGEAYATDEVSMFVDRAVPNEEVYAKLSFSPVFGPDARVEGLLCACNEVTDHVLYQRRLETLRKLAMQPEMPSIAQACSAAANVLEENPRDVPFAGIYLAADDAEHGQRIAAVGLPVDREFLPPSFLLDAPDPESPWPLSAAFHRPGSTAVGPLPELNLVPAHAAWPEPVVRAIIVPIRAAAQALPAGLLVAGTSPRRPVDAGYHTFLELAAAQLGRAIADARASEHVQGRMESLSERGASYWTRPRTPNRIEKVRTRPTRSSKIILADADVGMRDYIRGLLAARGHEVIEFSDGKAALDAAREERPHLMLADVLLPRLDGFGLVKALRADPQLRDIPIILLSGRAGPEADIDGLQRGADDYLVKPFSARELVARVATRLQLAAIRGAVQREREAATADRLDLLQRLETAYEDERHRIARDLHDQVGQTLTVLSLSLKAVEASGSLSRAAGERLRGAQRSIDELSRDVHALSVRLRPTALHDLGLRDALAQLVQDWATHTRVEVDYHDGCLAGHRLPTAVETAVFRVVQEALTNIARHAQARRASVSVAKHESQLIVIVEDDGRGFDPANAGSGRIGLLGMRERVTQVGGEFDVESAPNSGTTVIAKVPAAALEAAAASIDERNEPDPAAQPTR
jgi:signal transduction histidine kinase